MTTWWSRQSIRLRLTVWYAATLVVLLLLYGGGLTAFVWGSLSQTLDLRLRDDFEIAENMIDRAEDGAIRWVGPQHPHEGEDVGHQLWAEVWSPGGTRLYQGDMPSWVSDALPIPRSDREVTKRLTLSSGARLRYRDGPWEVSGEPVVLRVIRSEYSEYRTRATLLVIALFGLPLAAVLAGVGGYLLAQRLLDPVSRITERARDITATRLDERLPLNNPNDELGHLTDVLNTMFARLEQSFEQLRQFTSDASHELRAPLTNLRSVGEVALRGSRDEAAYRDTIGSMLEEGERLTRLVDVLLTLSRADNGRIVLQRETVDLAQFAVAVVDELCVLAEEKGQSLVVEAASPVSVWADRDILRHALGNLVDNAVKYSPDSASIRVVVRAANGSGIVEVIDQGPGIAVEHRSRVFERFYRVGTSRARVDGGSGLGLSIVRWAVEAHGGTVDVDSEVGTGSTFRVTLPMMDPGARERDG